MKRTVLFALILLTQLPLISQVKVSLVIDDNYGIAYTRAINHLKKTHPELTEKCTIKTFIYSKYFESDVSFVENSDLIFIYTMGAKVFQQARPQILKAIENGAHAYAIASSSAEMEYEKQGIHFNKQVMLYSGQKGLSNLCNMILYCLNKDLGINYDYKEPYIYPEHGIYSHINDSIYSNFQDFIGDYDALNKNNPWIGMLVGKHNLLMEQQEFVKTHIKYIERKGFNVLPIYGYPILGGIRKHFLDSAGNSRVRAILAMATWLGGNPDDLKELFAKTGVPVIKTVELYQTKAQWETSKQGIQTGNRANFIATPEISGQIQPTVTTSRETITDSLGTFMHKQAIGSQVRKMVNRLKNWYILQEKPNDEKQIALIYYSYPPGKGNIGASYLNVLPQSLVNILRKMKSEGYNLGNKIIHPDSIYNQIMAHGRNVGNWAPAETAEMIQTGEPVLVPVELYKKWYKNLSPVLRKSIETKWGKPDDCNVMTWKDKNNKKFFVLPAVKYGNILLTPQPARGWGQDASKMYHDIELPPHHQYIAFYLYLKHSYHADAIIHLGTHGTHEWLSGKETGLNNDDPSEALISDMINIYPYIVDDVGEGLQAKRRGQAIVIDHMTPPFNEAGLNPELEELASLISDYEAGKGKSSVLGSSKLKAIKKLTSKTGLLKDLGLDSIRTDDDVSKIEHYIKEIAEKQTPFGLHSFGQTPDSNHIDATAKAIASRLDNPSASEKDAFIRKVTRAIKQSAPRELESLMKALNGEYVPAATGNDPLRNPASLPTGNNFYAFDPDFIPAKSTFETGQKLAEELIAQYRENHNGQYPEKITMNLWSTECIRNEGIMESQILSLMGVTPVWSNSGRVKGVKAIPSSQLQRPRIDVTMVPSGLYRDVFPNLMTLLDSAVQVVKRIDETNNYIREHIMAARKMLLQKGIEEEMADRLASVRMFTTPSGAYGTGLPNVIEASGTWQKEEEVSGVYFNRMGHLFGQGFWGEKPEEVDQSLPANLSMELFKNSLSGTDMVVHSRSSNVYAALDNDDFFQYLGGTAMAIRAVDGKTPEVMVTNLSNPAQMGQETIDKFIGREMKSRYLSPEWIKEMLDEGYAGARFVNKMVFNLWGWQVTTPETIDENKWQQVYETYIEDKYELDIKEKFRKGGNLYAYQGVLSRMIETVRKDYWHPDQETMKKLVEEFNKTIEEVGVSCSGNVCDNEPLKNFIENELSKVPGMEKQNISRHKNAVKNLKNPDINQESIPSPNKQVAKEKPSENMKYVPKTEVKGYEMKEVTKQQNQTVKDTEAVKTGLLILIGIFVIAFLWKKKFF